MLCHFWESTKGEHLHTLAAVDIDTCWCELAVLSNRSQKSVQEAIDQIQGNLPFPLLGIDFDNDSAFLNGNFSRYYQAHKIMFTRCRPEKNDQAHGEEKNWSAVRKLVGYGRYESPEALALMKAIYAISGLFLNFFQPVRKLLAKERVGSKVRKKYDRIYTLYPRGLASPWASEETKARLREVYKTLNFGGPERRS